MKSSYLYLLILLFSTGTILSCQKEINGLSEVTINLTDQYPKVGTIWTYRFYTYYSYGALATQRVLHYKAISEETIGGEKWLKIVDMDKDTTAYLLNMKHDGLYQYTNNGPYLLCKTPATVNDVYTTFNDGSAETFTVRGVNDTLATGVGDIPMNYYEGVKDGYIIDLIWYNKNAWIVWETRYFRRIGPPGRYYLYSKMYLDDIVF